MNAKPQTQQIRSSRRKRRGAEDSLPAAAENAFDVSNPVEMLEVEPLGHSTARTLRQIGVQQLQRRHGNAHVQRMFRNQAMSTAQGGVVAPDSEASGSASIQRKIMVAGPGELYGSQLPARWNELTPALRRRFLRNHRDDLIINGRSRLRLAGRIMADMADASDELQYDSEDELLSEVKKRVTTAAMMRISQGLRVGGQWVHAFGYPNRPPARDTGPRVNEAALAYWGPVQQDSEDSYYFELSPTGRANAFEALQNLFVLQRDPRKRTLIHCDYLTSVLHFRAFAESIGHEEFNRRVRAGTIPMVLKWNGFDDVSQGTAGSAGAASLQEVTVSSPRDFIIGDHVTFFNHPMYDAIIQGVGGVWRLENAILVDRQGGTDLFQGHGYTTPVTEQHMKQSMLRHIRNHVGEVKQLIRATRRGRAAQRAQAQAELDRWENVKWTGSEWRVQGTAFDDIAVDEPLRVPGMDELPGIYDPWNPGQLYPVKRPVESQ